MTIRLASSALTVSPGKTRWIVGLTAGFALMHLANALPFSDPRAERGGPLAENAQWLLAPADPGCRNPATVSAGGAAPRDAGTLAVRWTGFSNFEMVYKGKVILLDAYFDRGSNYPPLGFAAADVKRADVILLGHGHFDHMSDAASVGIRTGATIVGAPVTTEVLKKQSVPDKQIRTVTGKGGESLQFDGFTVEPILGQHGTPDRHITEVMDGALNSLTPKLTPQQEEEGKLIRDRGTFDSRVIREGTIAYLITLDNGFRIYYRDSGGRVTDFEKSAMQRIPGVDLALVAVSADFLAPRVVQQAIEHMRLYKPDVYMPAHHDAAYSGHTPLWRPTEPIFQAMKDANPRLVTVSREYREPVCFNTEHNVQRGQ